MIDALLTVATLGWWAWSLLLPAVILLIRRRALSSFRVDVRTAGIVALLFSPGLLAGHGVAVLPVWASVPIIVSQNDWNRDSLQLLTLTLCAVLMWFAVSLAVLRVPRRQGG